jgi:uncharacterized protein
MSIILNLITGVLFGLGLCLAGMINPAKVLNFLDIAAISTGTWDASLIFVMLGGIIVTSAGFRLVLKRPQPFFASQFHLPTLSMIDKRIIIGPALFGIGWGIAGLCPGPALSALGYGTSQSLLFVTMMVIGMGAARWLISRS